MIYVKNNGVKSAMPLADVIADVVRERGVTEISAVDHNVEGKHKDQGPINPKLKQCCLEPCSLSPLTPQEENGQRTALTFRYLISPKAKVNAFQPKELDGDKDSWRLSMLGAWYHKKLDKLPNSKNLSTLWEVGPNKETFDAHECPL